MKASTPPGIGLTISIYAAGIFGALLTNALATAWQNFAPGLAASPPGAQGLLSDRNLLLLISVFIGVGCARAGIVTGPALSELLAADNRAWNVIPVMYTFIAAAMTGLIVHAVLLFMMLG